MEQLWSDIEKLNALYGSLWCSMMTMFRLVIGDLGFDSAAHALATVSPVYCALLICYVIVMVFGVLNVLTGVFCDAAMQAAQKDRDNMIQAQMDDRNSMFQDLSKVFEIADKDHSGTMEQGEFKEMLKDEQILSTLAAIGIKASEAEGLFDLLDDDNSGQVDILEFVSGCVRINGEAKSVDLITLLYENKKIAIKLEEIKRLVCAINYPSEATTQPESFTM